MRAAAWIVLAGALGASPAGAQGSAGRDVSRYEMQHGTPVDVSITDIILNPEQYERRAVRTRGRLDLPHRGGTDVFVLREGAATGIFIQPVPEVAAEWESNARHWLGRRIEITGVVYATGRNQITSETNAVIQFWSFTGPEEAPSKDVADKARGSSLEDLVTRPGSRDGDIVRVVGKFRGRNLYGDLPARSQSRSGDWVIKDDLYAVWVTGKKPKGDGWELDTDMKKDTGRWIEVVGRPTTRNGITYIKAMQVRLTEAPSATAEALPAPPPPPRPKVPPVIVFSLPLENDGEVPPNTQFKVQFSKDMNVESFKGRIHMAYAPLMPGDRPFDGLSVAYDGGLRTLTVDPGDLLRSGRTVELRFLPGIVDIEGLTLEARRDGVPDGLLDVMRYAVGH